MLTAARAEISALLRDVRTDRKPALRRALSDDWLLACDLPLCADAQAVSAWSARAVKQGWTVSEPDRGWLLLDRPDLLPAAGAPPDPIGGELGALISLLSRRSSFAPPDPRILRRLAKVSEASEAALEQECRALHQAFAARLREGEALPDCLPWLYAIAEQKEEKP